jgi:hypothetical protein
MKISNESRSDEKEIVTTADKPKVKKVVYSAFVAGEIRAFSIKHLFE